MRQLVWLVLGLCGLGLNAQSPYSMSVDTQVGGSFGYRQEGTTQSTSQYSLLAPRADIFWRLGIDSPFVRIDVGLRDTMGSWVQGTDDGGGALADANLPYKTTYFTLGLLGKYGLVFNQNQLWFGLGVAYWRAARYFAKDGSDYRETVETDLASKGVDSLFWDKFMAQAVVGFQMAVTPRVYVGPVVNFSYNLFPGPVNPADFGSAYATDKTKYEQRTYLDWNVDLALALGFRL